MKWLWILFLFPALAWGQSHEILRPTTDVNGSASISTALDSADCSTATYITSTIQPNWHDSGGLSTSSVFDLTNVSTSHTDCSSRVFKTWGTTINTYTSLTLNINTSGTDPGNGGKGTISYSVNGGVSWTQIRQSAIWSQITDTITLSAGQDLTQLQVAANDFANIDDAVLGSGEMTITGFDVWTDGVYTPPTPTPTPAIPATPPAIAQPIIISKVLLIFLASWRLLIGMSPWNRHI